MKEEIKEEVIEILENNNDVYEGCITDILNSLREFQDRLAESSIDYRILENIIDTLVEFENDDLDLLGMQKQLLTFVHMVEKDEFLPIIVSRDKVIRHLLDK